MGGMTALVERVIDSTKAYVADAFKSIIPRIEALERGLAEAKACSLEDVERAVAKEFARSPHPKDGLDGKSVTLDDVRPLIEDAIKAIPAPKDGTDGKNGENGKSVTLDDVRPMIEQAVTAIPPPKDGKDGEDGKSVTADDVLPALKAELQKAVESLPIPRDGKDGTNGNDGKSVTVDDFRSMFEAEQAKWALEFERRASDLIQRSIDRIQKPRDGKDGRDAFDLGDIRLSLGEDERTVTFAFARGSENIERSIVLTHPIYRGVWRDGKFTKGDSVTFGGSTWIATRDTASKPELDDSWRLAVKRGRDGKDGTSVKA